MIKFKDLSGWLQTAVIIAWVVGVTFAWFFLDAFFGAL